MATTTPRFAFDVDDSPDDIVMFTLPLVEDVVAEVDDVVDGDVADVVFFSVVVVVAAFLLVVSAAVVDFVVVEVVVVDGLFDGVNVCGVVVFNVVVVVVVVSLTVVVVVALVVVVVDVLVVVVLVLDVETVVEVGGDSVRKKYVICSYVLYKSLMYKSQL